MAATSALESRLEAAIASGDDRAICSVYRDIADGLSARGETDGACFFWTQALVYAMVEGDSQAESVLRERLTQFGRL